MRLLDVGTAKVRWLRGSGLLGLPRTFGDATIQECLAGALGFEGVR